ncbi:hypothetical protein L226DRAFT_574898 [Lentinus tigrinus ALCF2SS1-7]|uniref:Uncharacterized protein n=1 Tax=Lentinus tigrinus ALCF2SS1-6 TaxID=1328759 RepID=A0A5C2RVN0_9APHY|nr:hypothetical protein L227DRAFT_615564 [Lentinus tigrinus ALCF2SS1-6]RPD70381.1 hypothetical protein L226DRAFT_574898 [Lentinus tigrinus ALCF2SS1-7]
MFFFRATFAVALFSVAFMAQVSAIVWPLSRYMLDVIPEGEGDVHINPASAASQGAPGSLVGHTDVPEASGTSAVVDSQSDAAESSPVASASTVEPSSPAASSASEFSAASANGASHVVLGSTSVFIGSIVAGILLAA